ncbi:MAG: Spy/CpxP family protein refolding chaperone [Rhodospirillaceae bacterium]
MNKLLATIIVSTGFATGIPYAFAQTADTPQAAPSPRAQGMHHHGQRAHMSAADRVEARLAYIRTALKITDAQQPQWDAFASVLRKQAQQMDEFRRSRFAQGAQPAQRKPLTAIDRLERRQKMMIFASERLNEVITAAKPLYAALSPEQQKVADELLARQARARMGHRHGMHRGA